MSAKLYAKIGQMQEQLDDLNEAYNALLNMVASVVGGDIDRNRVLVNRTNRSWEVALPGQRPALPATINGLPQCVVAPNEVGMPGLPEAPPLGQPIALPTNGRGNLADLLNQGNLTDPMDRPN